MANNIYDLLLWQKAIQLTTKIYNGTANFPTTERYGLTNQMRRAAVSIPSNIAEGAGRNGKKEFNQFLGIANGSAYELQTQVVVAANLKFIQEPIKNELLEDISELQRMIWSLQRSLRL